MRALVEAVLRRCVAYKWEALKLSPHTHTGSPVRRIRVFYVGIYTDEHSEADGDAVTYEHSAAKKRARVDDDATTDPPPPSISTSSSTRISSPRWRHHWRARARALRRCAHLASRSLVDCDACVLGRLHAMLAWPSLDDSACDAGRGARSRHRLDDWMILVFAYWSRAAVYVV